MGLIFKLIRWGFIAVVVLFGAVLLASENGGEVVTLTTYAENGFGKETSLWVVESKRQIWIRAGQPGSASSIPSVPGIGIACS